MGDFTRMPSLSKQSPHSAQVGMGFTKGTPLEGTQGEYEILLVHWKPEVEHEKLTRMHEDCTWVLLTIREMRLPRVRVVDDVEDGPILSPEFALSSGLQQNMFASTRPPNSVNKSSSNNNTGTSQNNSHCSFSVIPDP